MRPGKDPGQQSIREILSSLKIKQLWAVGGDFVVLLGGAFTFGAWTDKQFMEVKLNQSQDKVSTLTSKIEEAESIIDLLRIKEKILAQIALYHGYESRASKPDATAEELEQFDQQAMKLYRTVNDYARKTLEGESKPSIHIRIAKGTQPSVVFEFDQTSFPLPAGLFAIAE